MQSLWFVVPARGRPDLARICLRQLRRTCDTLTDNGVEATAVVIADDENLGTAAALGFATVRRDNAALGRKYNDGIQLALDEKYNQRPADYVVPCGSDDWIDWRIMLDLPGPDEMRGFQRIAFVDETGTEMRTALANYRGGCGIRVYPRQVMERVKFRPAEEDRPRGCDTSILVALTRAYSRADQELAITYGDRHSYQIVDWKTSGQQINPYGQITRALRVGEPEDPFDALWGVFEEEALEEMAQFYARQRLMVPA